MNENGKDILSFIHVMEQLKHEFRHSWTSQGRQESVAEHSWRVALMLITCAPYLDQRMDLFKALKLAILHDIGEAKIGDKHYLDITASEDKKMTRSQQEKQAVKELAQLLGAEGSLITNLWNEFEEGNSEEAKIIFFLDKLEACIQHYEADITTWTTREIDSIEKYFEELKTEDRFLLSLKDAVKAEVFAKLGICK